MKKMSLFLFSFIAFLITTTALGFHVQQSVTQEKVLGEESNDTYWFILHRKSNLEYLYYGTPGQKEESELVKKFQVKTGVPGQKPTPLPQLMGREYWVITQKFETFESEETAPYFIALDIPTTENPPYGPVPYEECEGQCNWEIPGLFGLHGVAGVNKRLALQNEGSSGCIRHKDQDIAYLYNLLEPEKEEIRYYVLDI